MGITHLKIIPGADVLVARITDCEAALFPDEQAAVSRAVEKRRAEFAAGRSLARIALTEIGHAPCAIAQADRAPVWPLGIVGSITHSNDYVAVCVVNQTTHTATSGSGIIMTNDIFLLSPICTCV